MTALVAAAAAAEGTAETAPVGKGGQCQQRQEVLGKCKRAMAATSRQAGRVGGMQRQLAWHGYTRQLACNIWAVL